MEPVNMKDPNPVEVYKDLMTTIRSRFDLVNTLKAQRTDESFVDEIAAFQGRKILEGIAFGCLVAVENGVGAVPRDAEGQYRANKIFSSLDKRNLKVLPSPSEIHKATEEEFKKYGVT